MKYQLLHAWTPHSVFEAVNSGPACWQVFGETPPFTPPAYADFIDSVWSNATPEEALARWLVANTEGDW